MRDGLISYPRTDGERSPNPDPIALIGALHALERTTATAPALPTVARADHALRCLEVLAKAALESDHSQQMEAVIDYGRRMAGLLLKRRHWLYGRYQEAMKISASVWIRLHPPERAPYWPALLQCEQVLESASSRRARNAAQERIGVFATIYRLSALLGEHIMGMATDLPPAVDPKGLYLADDHCLICGSSYNANITFVLDFLGTELVLVGEAKGGSSGIGAVRASRILRDLGAGELIRQDSYWYALRNGIFMRNAAYPAEAATFRQKFGKAIWAAHDDNRLMFGLATGSMKRGELIAQANLSVPS